jgi:hypothetical protein
MLPGPGLPTKKSTRMHVIGDLAREALDVARKRQRHRRKLLVQPLIMAAQEDELGFYPGLGHAPRTIVSMGSRQ